nr:mammalian cell entry protein [Mycobacterium sp.]
MGVDGAEDCDAAMGSDDEHSKCSPSTKPSSRARLTTLISLVTIVVSAVLSGWLGWRMYQSHQADCQRQQFVVVARQSALNLTTIDWEHADTDIQRILDSATGSFYDDFSKRQRPFVEVVKQARSKSVGTITAAGIESYSGDQAQVLVAVSVQTSSVGATEQVPRAWRMRITVTKVADGAKVSNVDFVR